ncbi:MAG: peptide chain release factor 1 [Erysipelotrichaceae bacterium]|nr:peptide chain release factor 1 [Erysipelotrichaceae bacterium]
MDKMMSRLEGMEERYLQLNEMLMDSSIVSDPKQFAKLGKEQAQLAPTVETFQELKKVLASIEEAKMLLEENDAEMIEMAKMELEEKEPLRQQLLDRLELLLIPRDPNDDCDAIMEIRGAAGGDEGNIFAGDLLRMYTKYCEANGMRVEITEAVESEAGGFAQVGFIVHGDGAYGKLKFESGAHRVQRVPKTESAGRIHTSTATVLCLPDVEDVEIEIDPNDLTIETHRASGAGGQHINKTDSAVRITHIPTGITVNCQDGRSQIQNRETAMRLIKARVYDEYQRKIDEEKGEIRRGKIGTGDRSEKIRTYNYPQNRVTDHRIGFTIQQLDRVMEGKMDDVIQALLDADQKAKIAGEQE